MPSPVAVVTDLSRYHSLWDLHSVQGWSVSAHSGRKAQTAQRTSVGTGSRFWSDLCNVVTFSAVLSNVDEGVDRAGLEYLSPGLWASPKLRAPLCPCDIPSFMSGS